MKILSLFDLQQVTATGGGPELDLSGYAKNVKFAFAGVNTAGSTPTLAAKLQASAGLARGLEQSTAGSTDNKLKTGASTAVNLGLKFTQSGARSVKRVALQLKKIGTLASGKKLTLTIQTDSTGAPSGTAVTNGTSNTVDIDTAVGTSYGWVVFTFAKPVDLADATVYHLCLSADYTASSSNCVEWRSLTVASGGTFETWNGTDTWTPTTTESLEAYVDQYNFADVTSGAFTGLTTAATKAPEEKNLDLRTIGNPILRLYNTIGGTSNPAYYAGCTLVAQPIQET